MWGIKTSWNNVKYSLLVNFKFISTIWIQVSFSNEIQCLILLKYEIRIKVIKHYPLHTNIIKPYTSSMCTLQSFT